jgi:hypothetical protein
MHRGGRISPEKRAAVVLFRVVPFWMGGCRLGAACRGGRGAAAGAAKRAGGQGEGCNAPGGGGLHRSRVHRGVAAQGREGRRRSWWHARAHGQGQGAQGRRRKRRRPEGKKGVMQGVTGRLVGG